MKLNLQLWGIRDIINFIYRERNDFNEKSSDQNHCEVQGQRCGVCVDECQHF